MNQPMPLAPATADGFGVEEDLIALARSLYIAQTAELRTLADSMCKSPISSDDALKLAKLVHNIAGTASYFDNAELGRHAVAIEHQLRTAGFDDARQGACLALCDALDRYPSG